MGMMNCIGQQKSCVVSFIITHIPGVRGGVVLAVIPLYDEELTGEQGPDGMPPFYL